MSCNIKIKSLDKLRDDGAIGEKRIIEDLDKFNALNDQLTYIAYSKYGVGDNKVKLFNSTSKYIRNLDGSLRYILRAEPNEEMFAILEDAVGEDKILESKLNKSNVDNTKSGISSIFIENPELANIGTIEQYSQYLDTIFPDSKVKDIVYRTGEMDSKSTLFFVSPDKTYGEGLYFDNPNVTPMMINVQNPHIVTDIYNKEKDDVTNITDGKDGIIVDTTGIKVTPTQFDSQYEIAIKSDNIDNQIHILGSKQDIKGFKEYVDNTSPISSITKSVSELLDVNQPEKLKIDSKEIINEIEEEKGTINEFILFGNQENRTNYTAAEILENIITNFDGFSETSEFFLDKAKTLLSNTKATIKFVDSKDLQKSDTFMQYDPEANAIEISLEKLRTASTKFAVRGFLHEVSHSVSVNAYLNPQTVEQRMFKNVIDAAYNYYISQASDTSVYGFNNPLEFIAEAFTNPAFQKQLKDVDNAELKGFWAKFIAAIRRMFNMPKNSRFESLIKDIVDISKTEQASYETDTIFEIKSNINNVEEGYTNLLTTDDKLDNTIDKIEKNIRENIKVLERQKKISENVKDEDKAKNFAKYIEGLEELLNDIGVYKSANKMEALAVFSKRMVNSLEYIKDSIKDVDYSNEESLLNVFRIYNSYLNTFSVVKQMSKVIAEVDQDPEKDKIITAENLDALSKVVDNSRGEFESLKSKMYIVLKKAMKHKLNDFKYFPNVITDYRLELEKEHRNSKIIEDKDSWIQNKIHANRAELEQTLAEKVEELIEGISFDIYAIDVHMQSSINVSAPLIQILNTMLFQLQDNKNEIERVMYVELKDAYTKLSKSKGTTDVKKLTENIIDVNPKTGMPLLKGDYKSEFYFDVVLKLEENREAFSKKYKELLSELVEIKDINSSEYFNKKKERADLKKNYELSREKILKDNTDIDEHNYRTPKAKWLNDLTNLSEAEKDTLELFKTITKFTKDSTFAQGRNSLMKYQFGTIFYELPKITKSDTERLWTNDVGGIIKDKKEYFTTIRPDDVGYNIIETDIDNNRINRLKIYYRDISNTFNYKNQSFDLFNMYRLEHENGSIFKTRRDAEMEINAMLEIAKNSEYYQKEGTTRQMRQGSKKLNTIDGSKSNTSKMVENMIEAKLYDMMNKNNVKLGTVDLNKAVKFINSSSAFLDLSLNIASGTANVVNASAQMFLESLIKGRYLDGEGIKKANIIFGKDMMNIINDFTNPIKTSFVNQVHEMFDTQGLLRLANTNFVQTDMLKKGMNTEALQVFHQYGEFWMQSVIAMAVLDKIKVFNADNKLINKEGKVVKTIKEAASMLDMLKKDEITGLLQIDKNVVYTTASRMSKIDNGGKIQIAQLVRKKLYDLVGNYTETDQPEIMRHWYGKLSMLYRRYLIPMGLARLRGMEYMFKKSENLREDERRYSYSLQEYEEGSYVSLVRYISTAVQNKQYYILSKSNWNNLSDYERYNIRKAVIELVTTSIILPLSVMLVVGMAESGDDDDKEFLYFIAYQLRRLDTELSQYRSLSESFKMMKSPIPSARLLQNSLSIFESVFTPWSWGDEFESGPNKGQNKNWMRVKKTIPLVKEFQRTYEGLYGYQSKPWGGSM